MNRQRLDRHALAAVAAVCLLTACATPGPWDPNAVSDPLEPVNRGVFWVNDKFDVHLLTPVAKGWDFVAPDPVQRSISDFFSNLRFPIRFVNDVLQGKGRAAGEDLARFLVNSTVGLAGLLDPASRLGLEPGDEDFGQTLGRYGIPSGPYLVLPLLGPSNARDAVGGVVDWGTSVWPFFVPAYVSAGVRTTEVVNGRSRVHEEVEEERASAFDWYVFVRDAYLQRRHAQVRDEFVEPDAPSDAQYYLLETEEEPEVPPAAPEPVAPAAPEPPEPGTPEEGADVAP